MLEWKIAVLFIQNGEHHHYKNAHYFAEISYENV